MLTVAEIIRFLDEFAPAELAEDWDNAGLLVGRRTASVDRVMTCLTLTSDVAAEAVQERAQLVVTHHPVMFRATRQVTSDTADGDVLLTLIEAGIAVFSPHTRFDSAAEGINQQLAESFGLRQIQAIRESASVAGLGGGRWGKLDADTSLDEFLSCVKQVCGAEYLEFSGERESSVSTVAVACGSAAEFLRDAVRLGCDTFVTGEARFHSALEARAAGVNLVLVGHYSSERPAVERLAEVIGHRFPEIESFASRMESDPLTVYS
ncbi:MAG: Nif3-like dinuclear metal center hexameric protein [Planctomycetaceae bacterium]